MISMEDMSQPLPKVTILIPTFNRKDYVVQAVKSALRQDYSAINIMVSDNCSADGTEQVLARFADEPGFSYQKSTENIGMVRNWRKMLDSPEVGDWFILLSDDDYFIDEQYITKAVSLVQLDPTVAMVMASGFLEEVKTGVMTQLNMPYREIELGKHVLLNAPHIKPQAFTLCNVMFNTALARDLNAFRSPLNLYCDSEIFYKMSLRGKVGVVKQPATVYRFHDSNLVTKERSLDEIYTIAAELYVSVRSHIVASGQLNKTELDQYHRETFLPSIRGILVKLRRGRPDLYHRLRQLLQQDEVLDMVYTGSPVFRAKILLAEYPRLYSALLAIAHRLEN